MTRRMMRRKPTRQIETLESRLVLAPVIDVGDHVLLPDTPNQQIQFLVSGGDLVDGCNLNVQIADGGPEVGGTIVGPKITNIDLEHGIFSGNNEGQLDPELQVSATITTYTILNDGPDVLYLTGDPPVQISGANADDFTILEQPDPVILPGEQATFDVRFSPLAEGVRQATITIATNNADQNPIQFDIVGEAGADPFPQWEGRCIVTKCGEVVADGVLATVTIDTTGFKSGTWDVIVGDANVNEASDFVGFPAEIHEGHITLDSKPVANPDAYSMQKDTILHVRDDNGLLVNDVDPDGDALRVDVVSKPSHGNLAMNPDGSFNYNPDQHFVGTDTFQYRVWDGVMYSDPTTVTINVDNGLPVAVADSYATQMGATLKVNQHDGVLANDSDPDGDALTAQLVTGTAHGSLKLNENGSFEYNPEANYTGSDSFVYRASDGYAFSNSVVVTIAVNNGAPVAQVDNYSTSEDVVLQVASSNGVLANDSDPDGNPLSAELVKGPNHGTLVLNADGSFTYTPNAGYNGSDSFDYRASDGVLKSDATTATIQVGAVADIVHEYLVYNDSHWDGHSSRVTKAELNAVALDKTPLRDGQTAKYENVSDYDKGINEVVFFVDDLGDASKVDVNDFKFWVGNSNDTAKWTAAPLPKVTVQDNAGPDGEDLVYLVWENGAVRGKWLQIRMEANSDTGLSREDVSYWGSAPGDVGNSKNDFIVDGKDADLIRKNLRIFCNRATPETAYDINKDSYVNATDIYLAKKYATGGCGNSALNKITPNGADPIVHSLLPSVMQSNFSKISLKKVVQPADWYFANYR